METTQAHGQHFRSLRAERDAFFPSFSGPVVEIAGRGVGEDEPVFVIAEIGINHNGSLELCEKLIEGAHRAGCDAVKFQKRTPELCVPLDQWNVMRDTPWGRMSYIDYKRKIELGPNEFEHIDQVCKRLGILWFASCWDLPSIAAIERFTPPCYKAASASLTDHELLRGMKATGRPLIISTGMSSAEEIDAAVSAVGHKHLLIAHSTSTYPCPVDELNLRMIRSLKREYPRCPIGYSGHETGLAPTWAAVALGATFIERHITLDRAMWGTDHAASVELSGLERLVGQIRDVERAVGDGVKRVYDS
ncbi:MAG TPA: N-acetylneuraminate synthase family protein, partial [Polyangiaceae bacterium]|nr:N-acetylneuraminate synthase family protein [Polyangiaceae bacterium]